MAWCQVGDKSSSKPMMTKMQDWAETKTVPENWWFPSHPSHRASNVDNKSMWLSHHRNSFISFHFSSLFGHTIKQHSLTTTTKRWTPCFNRNSFCILKLWLYYCNTVFTHHIRGSHNAGNLGILIATLKESANSRELWDMNKAPNKHIFSGL